MQFNIRPVFKTKISPVLTLCDTKNMLQKRPGVISFKSYLIKNYNILSIIQ